MGDGLAIGEVAGRAGVSVRALRLYEAQGLLRPLRTAAGRRFYAAGDLARVQQVVALRRVGYSLTQIGRLLRQRTVDPARLLDLQIAALEAQRDAMAHMLGTLIAARDAVAVGRPVDLATLCDIIKLGETTMTDASWNDVWVKYDTPEEMQVWANAKQAFPAGDAEAYAERWSAIIARVEAAMAAELAATEPLAMALAKEWYEHQKPMVERVGVALWNKAGRMYAESDRWATATVKPPFSAAVFAWISEAAAAAREQGLIPPRAA